MEIQINHLPITDIWVLLKELTSIGSVTIRNEVDKDSTEINNFVFKMHPYTVSDSEEASWPGTQLLDGTARILKFELNDLSVKVLIERAKFATDFLHPHLPEDLSFYRKDGTPILISISHEKDCFLDLTSEEYEQIKTKLCAGSELGFKK